MKRVHFKVTSPQSCTGYTSIDFEDDGEQIPFRPGTGTMLFKNMIPDLKLGDSLTLTVESITIKGEW